MYDKEAIKKKLLAVKCNKCFAEKYIQKRSFNINVKKNGVYLCQPCGTINASKLISLRTKQKLSDPLIREKISKASQKNWDNNIFTIDKNLTKAIKSNKNDSKIKQISKTIKSKWINGDYNKRVTNINAEAISESLKHYWQIKENRLAASLRTQAAWKDLDIHINFMNGIVKRNTPEYREKLSKASKKLWKNKLYRKKMAEARANSKTDSILEQIAISVVKSLGFTPFKEAIDGWTWDILIKRDDQKDILIDIQGEYFHSLPEHANRDRLKFNHFKNNTDYEIHYLEEIDFYSIGNLRKKLMSILNQPKVKAVEFDFSNISIKECDKTQGNELLASYHYLNPSRNGIYHGAFLENELISICIFSPIIRKETATSLGLNHNQMLELSRFCIHPKYQKKNLASWFISRCIKEIKQAKKIVAIVAFSDTTLKHQGTIYKALGLSKPEMVKALTGILIKMEITITKSQSILKQVETNTRKQIMLKNTAS